MIDDALGESVCWHRILRFHETLWRRNVQSRDLLYHGAERLPFPFVTLAEIRYLFMGLVRFPLPVVAATSLSVAVSNKAVKLRDQPAQALSDSVQLIRRSFG